MNCHFNTNVNIISAKKKSILYIVAKNNNLKIVKILHTNEANIETICNNSFIVLHIASYYKNYQIVKLFFDHRAKVNVLSLSKQTPLFQLVTNNVVVNIKYNN